jgi:hypothetical protein
MLGSFLSGFQFDTGRGRHRGAGFTTPAGHDKAGVTFLDGPEQREATGCRFVRLSRTSIADEMREKHRRRELGE